MSLLNVLGILNYFTEWSSSDGYSFANTLVFRVLLQMLP